MQGASVIRIATWSRTPGGKEHHHGGMDIGGKDYHHGGVLHLLMTPSGGSLLGPLVGRTGLEMQMGTSKGRLLWKRQLSRRM